MSRSMRGEGTWDMESRGEPWSGEFWEAGYDALDWPGGDMWHCHHLMSRVWPMMMISQQPRYLHVDRYIPGPGSTHYGTQGHWSWPGRHWCQILVPRQCVWGITTMCVLLRIFWCLSTCCYSVLPSDQGQCSLPHLLSSWGLDPSLDDIIETITP